MWVTNHQSVEVPAPAFALVLPTRFTHNFSHKKKSLNSPLTWGYSIFPQASGLVTTTTYNYIKTPVRFPLSNFKNNQLLKTKNLQSFTTAGRLTK
jgi:hypothetical protein